MNEAQIHLLINHLPILGTLFGAITMIVALFIKNEGAIRTGLIFLVISGLMTIPAVISGEGAEEIVEEMNSGEEMHDLIHEHEEKAETAQWIGVLSALLAALTWYFRFQKRAFARIFTYLTLVIALTGCGYLIATGHSGGLISHPELRSGFEI